MNFENVKYQEISTLTEPFPQIVWDEVEYCKLNVKYVGDPAIVANKIDEAVASVRHLAIPGYRPGKAPDQAIKTKLKKHIDNFVGREMAVHAIDDMIFETNIKPIGTPKFHKITVKDKDFRCEFELWKKPVIELKKYNGFEIPKPHIDVSAESLAEKALFDIRMRFGNVEPFSEDDIVVEGDQITFSFTATINGEAFDGSVIEGEMYTVGQNRWPNFDQNLYGMRAGDERKFAFTFTDGELAGKEAQFTVSVPMGTKRKPHPVDEEFLAKVGFDSLDKLKAQLLTVSRANLIRQEQEQIRGQAAKQLVAENEFKVPDFMIDGEAFMMAGGEASFSLLAEDVKTTIKTQAERNVRLSLILDSVREVEPDAVLNDMEARNHLTNHLKNQGQDPSFINNPTAQVWVQNMIGSIKDEFTLQWICEKSKIVE